MDAEGRPSGGGWGQGEDESQVSAPSGTRRSDREMKRQPGRRVGCGLREFCWDHRDGRVLCDGAKSRSGSNNDHSSSGLRSVDEGAATSCHTAEEARFGAREFTVNGPSVQKHY